ncbi:MAG: hypothetical protein QM755_02835 [Luteolibacter sp.]
MTGAQFPLDIDMGLPLRLELQLMTDATTPCNLTDAEVEAHIRPCAGRDPLVTLTVEKTDEAGGKVVISATAEELSTLPERAAWNLIMTGTDQHPAVLIRGPVLLTGVIR